MLLPHKSTVQSLLAGLEQLALAPAKLVQLLDTTNMLSLFAIAEAGAVLFCGVSDQCARDSDTGEYPRLPHVANRGLNAHLAKVSRHHVHIRNCHIPSTSRNSAMTATSSSGTFFKSMRWYTGFSGFK